MSDVSDKRDKELFLLKKNSPTLKKQVSAVCRTYRTKEMAEDTLKNLRQAASPHDQEELTLVHEARLSAMRSYNTSPGKESKANWDAAREAYQETVDRLTAVYFPAEVKAPEGERFKNRKQAWGWLQAQGYKVSSGKFYQDCEAGFPAIHKDGSVSKYQAMQYGQQLDVERRGGERTNYDKEENEARKIKADADKAEMQADAMRREQDAEWMHADQAWASVASIIGVLHDNLRHSFYQAQGEIIHLAGGEQDRGPQVYAACEQIIDRAMNDAAKQATIEVTFADDDDDDDV